MRNKQSRVPDPNSFETSPGEKFHIIRAGKLAPDGTIKLTETGREDIQAKINSHVEETDMSVILHKLQCGDTSVLNPRPPMFGDFTQFPKTYAEALDLVNRSEDAFQSLSPELKSKYDNDRNKWFAAIGSESWMIDMGLIEKPVEKPVEVSE